MSIVDQAQRAYNAAVEARELAWAKLEELADDTNEETRSALLAEYDQLQADADKRKKDMDDAQARAEARANTPVVAAQTNSATGEIRQTPNFARPTGSTREEPTYRPDKIAERSFFNDLLARKSGDTDARDRLLRNTEEALDHYKQTVGIDYRDMSNSSTAGAEFLPTVYLNDLWVAPNIAKRPFADAVPKYPLPATGTTLSLPHLSSGVSVAGRSDAGSVSETDGVTASITHDVNEIAGQIDIGRIAVNRSAPGLDMVIGETLVRRYHAYLDTQLLSGTGTAPQHRGIRAVSGANSTTWTQTTPDGATGIKKIYEAISEIAENRIENEADTIIMHPRRADWLASTVGSSVPLFQQGSLMQAQGTQDNGFLETFAGLRVIRDVNVGTTYGAGTNQDEIYVVALSDLYLAEGPLFSRVFEDVGSGSGLIRYQVFAYSSFLSKRYPSSISIISGTGLVTPSWT